MLLCARATRVEYANNCAPEHWESIVNQPNWEKRWQMACIHAKRGKVCTSGLLPSSSMRILLFYFAELGGLGGVDVVVMNLASRFNAAGHTTGIIEVSKGPQTKRVLEGKTPVWSITAPSYPTPGRPRSWASCARAVAQFERAVWEFHPNVLNVHFPLIQCVPVVCAYAFPHKWRLVVTLHNSDIRLAPAKDPSLGPWQARLFARADAVTAVNQALLDDATSLYPSIAGKGHVVLNGVGPEWFQPLEDGIKDYVLFAGRLSHVKGVDLLLKAWSQISQRFPGTELRIAGDGEQRELLETMTSDLGIRDSVRFLGRQSQDKLRQLYAGAKAVILPSRREGLPLSLLEAGAAGAICIGSRTAGIPEIIEEGVTGYVVNAEVPEELGRGISKTLELNPQVRDTMRHAAQETIRMRFSEERMISDYLQLFASTNGSTSRP